MSAAGRRGKGHGCQEHWWEERVTAVRAGMTDSEAALHGGGWEGLTRCVASWAGALNGSVSPVLTAQQSAALNIPS